MPLNEKGVSNPYSHHFLREVDHGRKWQNVRSHPASQLSGERRSGVSREPKDDRGRHEDREARDAHDSDSNPGRRTRASSHGWKRTSGDHQIASQIDALNRDYRLQNLDREDIPQPFQPFAADTLIEFALAVRDPNGLATTGITRTLTSMDEFPYDDTDPLATEKLDELIKNGEFGMPAWPRDSYLNLWVCGLGGRLLGYAQFPGGPDATDGVVVLNRAFGTNGTAASPFNGGRTAVHEVGHWLNLLHIWGDDRGGCSRSDEVNDTPNQADSNGSDVPQGDFTATLPATTSRTATCS